MVTLTSLWRHSRTFRKNLKLVRDDSCSDSGVSVDVIQREAVDLEKRIREKLGQGVIKGKIANVGKKIAGGLSRFVGGIVDALFGGDDGDMGTSRGDTPPTAVSSTTEQSRCGISSTKIEFEFGKRVKSATASTKSVPPTALSA